MCTVLNFCHWSTPGHSDGRWRKQVRGGLLDLKWTCFHLGCVSRINECNRHEDDLQLGKLSINGLLHLLSQHFRAVGAGESAVKKIQVHVLLELILRRYSYI